MAKKTAKVWMDKHVWVEWTDANGKRVKPNTPGATKQRHETPKWYAFWRDTKTKRVKKAALATDKAAAQAMLADLVRDLERGQAGLTDPFERHHGTALADLVQEYLAYKTAAGMRPTTFTERRRILNAVIKGAKLRKLADLTPDKIDAYLLARIKSGLAARTVHQHRSAATDFAKWLHTTKRTPVNVLSTVIKAPKFRAVRPTRALSADELTRLLAAAAVRPLNTARTNKGGRNARKAPGRTHAADLHPETVARLEREGATRQLLYKVATLTGYRRRELRLLQVHHLHLDSTPPTIRQEDTKGGEKAIIPIPNALAAELRQHVADLAPDARVFSVGPDVSKVFARDRAAAGIARKDAAGRYVVFHSLRKSAATLLIMMGVPMKEAQSFLRHSNIQLTVDTYTDAGIVGMANALAAMETAYNKLSAPTPPAAPAAPTPPPPPG
jgi:integrase